MSQKKPDELLNWMDSFRNNLDVGESTVIYKTLKENKFSTRIQIKLITENELDIMFKGETALSLGARALLQYQISSLNEQSPLPNKTIRNLNTTAQNTTDNESFTSSTEKADKVTLYKCIVFILL